MSKEDNLTVALAGFVAFAITTAYYAAFGAGLLETAFWFYAVNAMLIGAAGAFLFHAATRLRRVPRRKHWLAAVVFAAPGLVGAAVMAAMFRDIFPDWDPVSLGRYAAFVLFGDALLAMAVINVPARASSPAR